MESWASRKIDGPLNLTLLFQSHRHGTLIVSAFGPVEMAVQKLCFKKHWQLSLWVRVFV